MNHALNVLLLNDDIYNKCRCTIWLINYIHECLSIKRIQKQEANKPRNKEKWCKTKKMKRKFNKKYEYF